MRHLIPLLASAAMLLSSGTAYADLGDELFILLASDGSAYDAFGLTVSVDNGVVAIGAHGDDDNGLYSGSAYLFNASTGAQIAKLLPSDGARSDYFGWSIAIDNGVVAVGAILDDDNGADSGSAYLFDADTSTRTPATLTGFGVTTGVLLNGVLADLGSSDDSYIHTRSGFGPSFIDTI